LLISVATLLGLAFFGCTATQVEHTGADASYPQVLAVNADNVMVVDCLLPGQVRKLGRMNYLTPRRPVRTTVLECEIRGGEYVAYDRSDLATSLSVWLPLAKTGDAEAQTYVGEIYQRGMGAAPNFKLAAQWFQKAAQQNYPRAQMSLGYLYEQGLGVPKDPLVALNWYRRATGLDKTLALNTVSPIPEDAQELERLRKEVKQQKAQTEQLQNLLEQTNRDLVQTRQELEHQSKTVLSERKKLEVARKDLDRSRNDLAQKDSPQLSLLEVELSRREAELDKRRRHIDSLNQKILNQEAEVAEYRETVTRYQKQIENLPSPIIEVFDPIPVATRGLEIHKAQVNPESGKQRVVGRVWAPAGLTNFQVNQVNEKLAPNGSFSVWVPVTGKESTEIEIVAVDANGKEGRFSLQLAALRGTSNAPSKPTVMETFDLGKFYALVIGNNEYHHLPKLNTAVNDARSIAEELKTHYGFETTLLLNAGRADILLALDKFRKQLTEKDNFLMYYAGHGELDQKNKRGYWLPVDADADSTVQWIRTYQITDTLNLMSPLRSLVIADACYSGIMTRSAMTRLESASTQDLRYNLIKVLAKKRARVVLSSGGLKPVLDSGNQGHSVYAGSLIKILATNQDVLKAQELHDEVTKNVAFASERLGLLQVPQYGGLIHSGHEMGDFIFVPEKRSGKSISQSTVPAAESVRLASAQ
jgi:hypothetical protein